MRKRRVYCWQSNIAERCSYILTDIETWHGSASMSFHISRLVCFDKSFEGRSYCTIRRWYYITYKYIYTSYFSFALLLSSMSKRPASLSRQNLASFTQISSDCTCFIIAMIIWHHKTSDKRVKSCCLAVERTGPNRSLQCYLRTHARGQPLCFPDFHLPCSRGITLYCLIGTLISLKIIRFLTVQFVFVIQFIFPNIFKRLVHQRSIILRVYRCYDMWMTGEWVLRDPRLAELRRSFFSETALLLVDDGCSNVRCNSSSRTKSRSAGIGEDDAVPRTLDSGGVWNKQDHPSDASTVHFVVLGLLPPLWISIQS